MITFVHSSFLQTMQNISSSTSTSLLIIIICLKEVLVHQNRFKHHPEHFLQSDVFDRILYSKMMWYHLWHRCISNCHLMATDRIFIITTHFWSYYEPSQSSTVGIGTTTFTRLSSFLYYSMLLISNRIWFNLWILDWSFIKPQIITANYKW